MSTTEMMESIRKCSSVTFEVHIVHSDEVVDKKKDELNKAANLTKSLAENLCSVIKSSVSINDEKLTSESNKGSKKVLSYLNKGQPDKALAELQSMPDDTKITYLVSTVKVAMDAYAKFIEANEHLEKSNDEKNKASVASEKNAYLEIALSCIGMSFICCENGCNGTSPLSLTINGLRAYYGVHGYFPAFLSSNDESSHQERKDYYSIVSTHIIEGYCQKILEASSKGCAGISNLKESFGSDMLDAIVSNLEDFGVYRGTKYLNDMFDTISELENANLNNDLKLRKEAIQQEMTAFANIDKTIKASGEDKSNLIKKYLIPNSDEIIGNKLYETRMKMRIKELFDLDSVEELQKLILEASSSTSTTLNSTAAKIRKFKSSINANVLGSESQSS